MSPDGLRVIDFGRASPLRSQTLWHAVAHGVSDGSPPTLSFVRPSDPYVCIGYHRRIEEVDLAQCEARGWPVYRRMVGGGPVYLDSGQLFFQITLPMAMVPAARHKALRSLLEPAVEAFRAGGVDAHIDDRLEIVVGDRKVCGYGAGQIGDAAVVVGNLIETFDHAAASSVLRPPTSAARAELGRLVSRYVAATPTDPIKFRDSAMERYGESLRLEPSFGELSAGEEEHLVRLDEKFVDPNWIKGPSRPTPPAWQAKIRAGVWVFSASCDGTELTIGVDERRVLNADLVDPELNGQAASLGAALVGLDLADAASVLDAAGTPGSRLSDLLTLAEPRRL
jgi:lipoate-protein ligase A